MVPVAADSVWTRGVLAAEAILKKVHRVSVAKVLDPLVDSDFLVMVERLSASLKSSTGPTEGAAIRRSLRALDVDWENLSAAQRDRAFVAADVAIGRAFPGVVRAVRIQLQGPRGAMFGPTRRSWARRSRTRAFPRAITISPQLSATDRVAERLVRTSSTNFVRDELGRRRDDLSEKAREIVARGLDQGLGRDVIARDLAAAFGDRIVRSEAYYEVVAGAYMNRARTYSSLLSFQDAGVENYVFEAVLDEVTTDICRFYHGQTFSTSKGIEAMNRTLELEDPEQIKDVSPWLRTGKSPDGTRNIFFMRGGQRVRVAQIDRSGVGNRDDVGSYSRAMTPRQLEAAGIPFPPLHGRCRSTVVADV